MLVVSRKVGEQVEFPDLGIAIRLVGIRASRAEIGIEAPRSLQILRGELVAAKPHCTRDGSGGTKEKSQENVLVSELTKLKAMAQALAKSGSAVETAAPIELVDELRALLAQLSPSSARRVQGSNIHDSGEADRRPFALAEPDQVRQSPVDYAVGTHVSASSTCAYQA